MSFESAPVGYGMLRHITAGRLADGSEAPMPLDPFPEIADPDLLRITEAAFDLSARILGRQDSGIPPVNFALFLRAILGSVHSATYTGGGFLAVVAQAADYVSDYPETVLSNPDIDSLCTAAGRIRRARRTPDATNHLEEKRRKAGAPPMERCWQSECEGYDLYQATHPFHVWEMGVRGTLHHSYLDHNNPVNAARWNRMARGTYDLFLLRSIKSRLCVFGIGGGCLQDVVIHDHLNHALHDMIANVTQYFHNRFGPYGISPLVYIRLERELAIRDLRGWPVLQQRMPPGDISDFLPPPEGDSSE